MIFVTEQTIKKLRMKKIQYKFFGLLLAELFGGCSVNQNSRLARL